MRLFKILDAFQKLKNHELPFKILIANNVKAKLKIEKAKYRTAGVSVKAIMICSYRKLYEEKTNTNASKTKLKNRFCNQKIILRRNV
jgi:hypothetical protein